MQEGAEGMWAQTLAEPPLGQIQRLLRPFVGRQCMPRGSPAARGEGELARCERHRAIWREPKKPPDTHADTEPEEQYCSGQPQSSGGWRTKNCPGSPVSFCGSAAGGLEARCRGQGTGRWSSSPRHPGHTSSSVADRRQRIYRKLWTTAYWSNCTRSPRRRTRYKQRPQPQQRKLPLRISNRYLLQHRTRRPSK